MKNYMIVICVLCFHEIKIIKSKLVSDTGVVRLPWQLI